VIFMDEFHPSGRQLAAARTLVGMSQAAVAETAHISIPTLKRMEASEGPAAGMANNVAAVRRALEAAGIEFTPEGDEVGEGVRLRKKADPYAGFGFPIFTIEMPFGTGRFGVYRDPAESFNKWHGLTLLQLSDPQQDFGTDPDPQSALKYAEEHGRFPIGSNDRMFSFWIETLNTGSVLEDLLGAALAQVSGPRKPDHPSKLHWVLYQPKDVYLGAREFVIDLKIDWNASPVQIDLRKTESSLSHGKPHLMTQRRPTLNYSDWWRLDKL